MTEAGDPCLGTVAAIGVDDACRRVVVAQLDGTLCWREWPGDARPENLPPEEILQSDVVLLGTLLGDPLAMAQRVHRVDNTIPVLIVVPAERIPQLERSILFASALGTEVRPWSMDRLEGLPQALRVAAERRQQRSSYLHTMQSAQMHLGKLSLFQPEVTHYLDRLLDRVPVGVITVDARGSVLSMSPRAEAILGVTERDVLGAPVKSFFVETEHGPLAAHLQVATGAEFSPPRIFQVATGRATPSYVEATVAPLAYHVGQRGAMLILQDVTERVRAERERARAELDLRSHVKLLSALHAITSARDCGFAAKVHRLLEFGCEHLGLPFGYLARIEDGLLHMIDVMSPDGVVQAKSCIDLTSTYCDMTRQLTDPLSIDFVDVDAHEPGPRLGGQRIKSYLGAPVVVRDRVYGTIAFAGVTPRSAPFSLSERETMKLMAQWIGGQLEREADEAQMRILSSALEQAADSIAITDRRGIIEYVNPAHERLTGYRRDEALGRKTSILRSGLHDDAFYADLWGRIAAGEVFRGVLVNRRKDGGVYHEDKTIASLRDANGEITHFVSTGHDVTARLKDEEAARLREAEMAHVARLSVLGEMTSGLAHELTQPLCAITTYAQTCLRIAETDDASLEQIRYGLQQVVKQAELGSSIFLRLRKFARKGEPMCRLTGVQQMIREAVDLIRADVALSEVKLRIDHGRWSPKVKVDPIQIQQVILNLARNSLDALSGVDPSQRKLVIRSARADDAVKVSIVDSGRGCPPALVERLFQPFFTTKPNGLGIGLSISQTIIQAHGGRLWMEENGERGATFSFTLPLG